MAGTGLLSIMFAHNGKDLYLTNKDTFLPLSECPIQISHHVTEHHFINMHHYQAKLNGISHLLLSSAHFMKIF